MDLHYKREATVGVLVIAGIAVFLTGTMWLRGRDFASAGRAVARSPVAGPVPARAETGEIPPPVSVHRHRL